MHARVNNFFYSVFIHSSFLLPSTDNLPTPVVSLGDISITEPDVYTALASLDPSKALVSQASRIFPRAHARGKGGGGREGKIRLVRCAGFSFRLPECWQSQ